MYTETYPSTTGSFYNETVNCASSGGGSTGGGSSCTYDVEMVCGSGWLYAYFYAYIDGNQQGSFLYPSQCGFTSSHTSPADSETDSFTVYSGEVFSLEYEDTSSGSNPADVEIYVTGASTDYYIGGAGASSTWTFSHTCP